MKREPISQYFRLALQEIIGQKPKRGVQIRVAEAAEISATYLNDILKGRTDGSEDVRRAISKAVERSYEQMINRGREIAQSQKGAEDTVPTDETVKRDIRWILTGTRPRTEKRGDRTTGLNADLLRKIIQEVETGLSRREMALDPVKKARLITLLYEQSIISGKSTGKKIVDSFLDLLA
jgi:transcriptional regulator with XRE-family HTH domain